MSEQVGPRAFLRNLRTQIPEWSETLPELPKLLHTYLSRQGSDERPRQAEELRTLRRELRRAHRRSLAALVGTGLVLAASLIYGLDGHQPRLIIAGAPLASWLFGGLGLALLASAWNDGD